MENSVQEGMMQLLPVGYECSGTPSWCDAAPCRGTRSVTETHVAARYTALRLCQSIPAQASYCVYMVVQ